MNAQIEKSFRKKQLFIVTQLQEISPEPRQIKQDAWPMRWTNAPHMISPHAFKAHTIIVKEHMTQRLASARVL